jgi:hypothetical protein
MKTFKLALAGLAALGAAVVAAPEPAKAGGFGISFGFGHPGYYGGYYPASYGYGWRHRYGYYHRPYARKVVVVHRPYYPAYYHRPYVKRVVYGYPRHYGYYRPHRVRYVSYGHRQHYGYGYRHRRWW